MNPPESSVPPGSLPGDDARFEQMLRETSQAYINDAGFTGRIMGALPPPRRRAERRRRLLLIGAVLVGCSQMMLLGGSDLVAFFGRASERLVAWSTFPVPGLGAAFSVGVLVCWFATLAAGYWAWARRA
jgi:hypothetical protein